MFCESSPKDMRTRRLRKKIAEMLIEMDRPMVFGEILEWINDNTKWGSTPSQMGNILSKNPEFIEVDKVLVAGSTPRTGRYLHTVWIHESQREKELAP